jgi:phosphate:Na+ symporter
MTQEIPASIENLEQLFSVIEDNYTSALNNFYVEAQNASLEKIDITTIINFI